MGLLAILRRFSTNLEFASSDDNDNNRQVGQTSVDEVRRRDLRAELLAAEREAQNKKRKAEGKPPLPEEGALKPIAAIENGASGAASESDEANKRRKLLQEALELDKDDDSDEEDEDESKGKMKAATGGNGDDDDEDMDEDERFVLRVTSSILLLSNASPVLFRRYIVKKKKTRTRKTRQQS